MPYKTSDITDELSSADLLICKNVLQHLSNAMVARFIRKNLMPGKFRLALITNDVGTGPVPDISPGQYRRIDLRQPPFNLKNIEELPIVFPGEPTNKTHLLRLVTPPQPGNEQLPNH